MTQINRSRVTEEQELEAFAELISICQRRRGDLPAELLAQNVLGVTAGGDWPLQRGAMDALLRRLASARREELRVVSRPGRSVLGLYRTGQRRSLTRPYLTLLWRVEPTLGGSCDCHDFRHGSLGLCKHLLTVASDLYGDPARLERARSPRTLKAVRDSARLVWDPVRPLTGAGDWLERVAWYSGALARRPASNVPLPVRRLFEPAGQLWPLRSVPADLGARQSVVRALLRLVQGDLGRAGRLPHDPALLPQLEYEREQLKRLTGGARLVAKLQDTLASLPLPLYPYQVEGLERFLASGRLLLADDMGLGKTVQAIAACNALYRTRKIRRGLIVVPASLKSQWLREWQQFCDLPAAVVEGNPEQRQKIYEKTRRGFLITNYEQVLRDLPLMHGWAPQLVVLDEAQRIKNWATKTATFIKRLDPPYRLVLTGTPLENRLEELASITDWVDRPALEPKWRLGPWHTMTLDGGQESAGARNLDTLRARLAPSMVRRVRQEVLDQLPPRTDTMLPAEMTAPQREEHDALKRPIMSLMQRAKKRPLTRAEFLRLMQLLTVQRIICDGLALHQFSEIWPTLELSRHPTEALLRGLASPKLEEFRELVAQVVVGQGRKVVVFSQWRRMLQLCGWAVGDLLEQGRCRQVFFTGQESQKRRTQNIIDFHDDPATALLMCTDAGGVGLNLQRAASCVVNLDLPWNPAVLEQRIGRVYRLGQTEPIQVYNLVCEQGIEARISGVLADKQALFKGLFDGQSDQVVYDRKGSFMERLERLVEPVALPELGDVEREEDLLSEDDAEDLLPQEPPVTAAPPPEVQETPEVQEAPPVQETPPQAQQQPGAAPPAPSVQAVTELLARVQVRPRQDGGITIDAPPEAAGAMAMMFQTMANLMTRAAGAAEPGGPR